MSAALAYLVQGEDPGLVSQALSALLGRLSEGEPLAPVEEYGETGRSEPRPGELGPVAAALEACRTPPFLAARRVVVLRDTSALDAAQLRLVVEYLAEPLSTTVLVLAHPGRAAPASLAKAVRAVGEVVDAAPGATASARGAWWAARLKDAPVRLAPDASQRLAAHLGEDVARLDGVLEQLASAYGPRARIGADDLEPFLGDAGGAAPWDLTDAIDAGDADRAVAMLHRMLDAGERHPLQVVATLHRHFGAMLRLEGSGAADEQSAAQVSGLKPYPARKALAQSRRLGREGVARAISLLAAADLDLRGATGLPGDLVLELVVARLARLAGTKQRR